MTPATKLRAVAESAEEPPPDLSYEYLDRQHIASRDWSAVHCAADRREALPFFGRVLRTWRG